MLQPLQHLLPAWGKKETLLTNVVVVYSPTMIMLYFPDSHFVDFCCGQDTSTVGAHILQKFNVENVKMEVFFR